MTQTSIEIVAEVSGIDKVDALEKSVDGLSAQTAAAAAEEERLAAIVEASKRRQQLAAQELLEAERKAASEATLAANKVAAAQREAAAAVESLNAAFRQLGIRPLQDVVAETKRLQAALAQVRASGVTSPEQQQAIAAFTARLAALKAEAGGVPSSVTPAAAAVGALGRESEHAGTLIAGAAGQIAALVTAGLGLQSITSVAADIVNTGAAFQTLEGRLSSMLGSADAARDVFGQIKDLAKTTPFEVGALTESYAKLTAFGLQPSMAQMQAITDTAATLGGGTEKLERVTLALGQAWTKSKLQGDEILQLAEAGVPVWDLLAEATGKNTTELQKMSAAGTLGRDVILKLIDALGRENAGASAKLMETYAGAVSNAKDALNEFYALIANSGVLDYLTRQLQGLLVEFDRMKADGSLQAEAKAIADGFVRMAEGIKTAVEAVSSMSGVIKIGLEAWVAYRLAGMTLIPMLGSVGTATAAVAVETRAMAAAQAAATYETRALGVAAGTTTAGMGLLVNGLRLVKGLSLVGLVTEVADLGMEFFRAKAEAEATARNVERILAPKPDNGPAKEFKLVETNAALARIKTEELASAFYQLRQAGEEAAPALKKALDAARFDSPESFGNVLRGLAQIRGSAQQTGDEIRDGLAARLQDLSGKDLQEFATMADFAFKRGQIGVNDLTLALDAQLQAALNKVGVNASVAGDGMSAKFRDSAGVVSLLTGRLDDLRGKGVDTDRVFQELITKTLAGAGSRREFEFLARQVEDFGLKAGLAQSDVDKLLESIRAKAEGGRPGIQSLADAMERLGLKSRESLQAAEQAAKDAFDYIKSKGGTIAEQAAAWDKYAEAAKAAHNGILPPMLRAQDELYKIGTAGRAAGQGISQGMATGGAEIARMRTDAELLADTLERIKTQRLGDAGVTSSNNTATFEDMRRAGVTAEQMAGMGYTSREIEDYLNKNDQAAPGTVNRSVSTSSTSNYAIGVQNGLNDEQAKVFAELYGYYVEKANADARNQAGATLGLGFGVNDYAGLQKQALDEALAAARKQTSAEAVSKAENRVGDFFSAGRYVTVNLNINGKNTQVRAADQASADALVRALQEAQAQL